MLAATTSRAAGPEPASLTMPGVHPGVVFDAYPESASGQQVVSRFLSPLEAEAIQRRLRASSSVIQPRFFDIEGESFLVYVPRSQPAAGYGLLVFVPPWPKAQIPPGWTEVLDRYGVILVSADRSGNDDAVLDRRVPLALAALAGVQAAFRIDPERTLVGGFSGGSRVALRMALTWPDLFRGALLNAGSDPVAAPPQHLPSAELFQAFQTRSRIAYVTGSLDQAAQDLDSASRASMQHWCVGDVTTVDEPGVAHDPATGRALDRAFQALFATPAPDTSRLAACRQARRQDASAAIDKAQRVVAGGDAADARRTLIAIDGGYGGLVAPQSVQLADKCGCGILEVSPAAAR